MDMDAEVFVKLTEEQRQERHASILHHLGEAERLEAKKKAEAKATQELIDHEWSECYRLRRVLLDDQENRRQGDLRFGDEVVPSTDEATAALAAVAAVPTEPHEYVEQENVEACKLCGAELDDPIHHGGELLPHVFSPGTAENGDESHECAFDGCGRAEGDQVHDIAGGQRPDPVPAPPAEDAPPVAHCGACAAKLCRAHPHEFNPDATHDGDRCTCGFGKRAKVHRVEFEDVLTPKGDDGEAWKDDSGEDAHPPAEAQG